jgi:hypothetical protein
MIGIMTDENAQEVTIALFTKSDSIPGASGSGADTNNFSFLIFYISTIPPE